MEIICDILLVIHEGSARPTQIMHKANLTWPVLMTHLEALLRHELLTRETSLSRTTYKLTAKGSAVLNIYLRLREEVDALQLERTLAQRLDEAQETAPAPKAKKATLSSMQSVMEGANFRLRNAPVPGRSGMNHRFDLVAEGLSKSLYGFDILTHVTESEVIRVFVKQVDSDVSVQMVYTKSASELAERLAGSYSLGLVNARDFKRFADLIAFHDALLPNRRVLLEVDPSQDYESVLRELVQDEARRGRVSAFTWKGGPFYPVLPRGENVYVYVMAARESRPISSGPREFVVASHDEASLLELLEGLAPKGSADRGDLVIFDSVSELLVSMGNDRCQRFLKRAARSLDASGRRSLFIMRRGYHDERSARMVEGLFSERLVYDSSGLRLDRTA